MVMNEWRKYIEPLSDSDASTGSVEDSPVRWPKLRLVKLYLIEDDFPARFTYFFLLVLPTLQELVFTYCRRIHLRVAALDHAGGIQIGALRDDTHICGRDSNHTITDIL